jgi:hypothetical protein
MFLTDLDAARALLRTVQPAATQQSNTGVGLLFRGSFGIPKGHVRMHQSEKTGAYFYRRNRI